MSGFAAIVPNMGIGTKIACTIGILFLAIALIGGFALRGIDRMSAAAEQVSRDRLPSSQEAGYLRDALSRHRTLTARHVLAADKAQKAQADGFLDGVRAA